MVHRLDQPVEGIIAFARNKKAAAALSSDVNNGRREKEYMAAVKKEPACDNEWHDLTDCMLRDGKTNTSRVVPKGTEGAKTARLSYLEMPETVTVGGEEGVLLRIRLYTGRHHQIRVQLSHAGMPILGDRKYGPQMDSRPGTLLPLCLSAFRLTLRHPSKGERMQFESCPSFLPPLQ